MISEASAKWRGVCLDYQSGCTKLLGPFLASTAAINGSEHNCEAPLNLQSGGLLEITDDWWTRIKVARMESLQAAGTVFLAGTVLSFVIVTSWFPPVALGGALLAGCWGLVRGWQVATAGQIKAARQELHRHLASILQEVRKHFFDVNLNSGRFSRVDEYFNGMDKLLADHVALLAKQKLEQAQAEIKRLVEESQLDDQQRKARAEQTRKHLTEWDEIGQEIMNLQSELKDLDQSLQSKQSL